MAKPRDTRQKDLLRPPLDQIIDLKHPLVRLAQRIDWGFLESRFAAVCCRGAGQPGLPTRLVAGLMILKHMESLSDESLCARWVENPYYQYFCGEHVFRHEAPFAGQAGTQRRAEAAPELRTGRQTRRHQGRPLHAARQFKRAQRQLRFLRTRLGRLIRAHSPQDCWKPSPERAVRPVARAGRSGANADRGQRGPKVYALHAPEVECIGKGIARMPYEFGCKVSIATPATSSRGGQCRVRRRRL